MPTIQRKLALRMGQDGSAGHLSPTAARYQASVAVMPAERGSVTNPDIEPG